MFFILSKTVGFVLLPSNFLLLLALAGTVLLATRWRRAGLRMVIGAVVLLAMVGLLPVGTFLIHGLENRFPQWDAARGTPDAVIARLNKELVRIIRTPDIRARLAGQGAEVVTMTAPEQDQFFAKERARWAQVIQQANVKLD